MRVSLDELAALVRQGRIDTVITAFTDMQGRFVGKRVTGEFFCAEVAEAGIHFCNYLLGTDMEMNTPPGFAGLGWEQGYGDWRAVPDPDALRVVPWLPGTAFAICDVLDEAGEPVAVAPRGMLRRQIAAAASAGLRPKMAAELEFYLLRETYESLRQKGYHGLETYGAYLEDYHILQGTKAEPVYREIRNAMVAAGVPVEFSKGEAGPGQHEINLRYGDALEAADACALLRQGAKEIAMAHGLCITFMAKLDHALTGSSCHIHLSLWDQAGERNLFAAGPGPRAWSPLMRQATAGLCRFGRDFALLLAPTVNAYKRYAPGSWAPVNLTWGWDNRTCGLRLVGAGSGLRIEARLPGADANPYLAATAVLAAALHGIGAGAEPPAPFEGNAYAAAGVSRMPSTLGEAAAVLAASTAAREALGDAVVEHYAHAGALEQAAFDRVVTCWERERYLERG